jgi:lipoprotein-anchoring transpeptidase ErfK/SrfK
LNESFIGQESRVMKTALSRRAVMLAVAGSASLLATRAFANPHPLYGGEGGVAPLRDESLYPPAQSPIDYPIELVDKDDIPERFHRQIVSWEGFEVPGSIVIDPGQKFLYLVGDNGSAIRYGVGVGRAGFAWHGEATIGMKRRWPRWLPPEEMIYRDAKALEWANGMPGGPDNPLGARALYLHANGQDTLYRIHGTNEPSSIGQAMSSGCIRMLNEDVADLFERVPVGAKVTVLQADI